MRRVNGVETAGDSAWVWKIGTANADSSPGRATIRRAKRFAIMIAVNSSVVASRSAGAEKALQSYAVSGRYEPGGDAARYGAR